MSEYIKENHPIGCPEDADTTFIDANMCEARSPSERWVCTRPNGHRGLHHAHGSLKECLEKWE